MVDCGFVSRILPTETFREQILEIAGDAAKLSPDALKVTKDLIKDNDRELLEKINQEEMRMLEIRMASTDSLESIMRFVGKFKRTTNMISLLNKNTIYRGNS